MFPSHVNSLEFALTDILLSKGEIIGSEDRQEAFSEF